MPPVANAGANQTITLRHSILLTLDGSASSDANGTITNYSWTKIAGPAQGTIVSATGVFTVVNNLVQGTYTFRLLVTNSTGETGADTVIVTVNAAVLPPVANAGPSQTITLPTNSASLNGTQSSASSGTIVSFSWTEVSGPSTATITNGNTSTPTVSALITGQYVFPTHCKR